MVQLYCKLCLQSTPSTNWKTHITQKEHLQQLPLKILVRGLQKEKIDEVYAYFGRFGGIRSQNIIEKGDVVAIEYRFWDARVYCDVIHSEHTILGQDVEICWYKKPKTGNLQLVVQDEKMENEKFTYRKLALIEATKPPPKFADQLTVFQTHLQTIQDKLKETRQEIHADLTAALTPTFPYNKLHFFGSSITNLDLPDSCLDIYLDNTDSSAATLDQIKALISDGNFTDAGVVIREVPLLQFKHKTSKISCVLSTKNELPVGQSELMKFYQSLNEKVKDLMLVVKFWADCHALRHGEGFSGYALNLMVIFYLQQEPYKLPSVFDLQKESPCDEIDGWNCAFGPVEFTDSLQSATILDLLVGFFQFYGNFDYGKRVISVFSGSGIDKSCFIKPDDLPECFQDYFNQENAFVVTDGVCIQDPFVHCENVTVTVPLSSPGKLAGACRKSLQISREGETELLSKFLLFSGSNEFFVNNFDETTLKNLLLKILEDVCCCEVTATSSDGEAFYHATGEYNVWEKRVEMSKKLAHESNIMAYETAITSLVKNFAQTQSWSLTITMRLEPLKARVEFKGSDGFSVLPHLEHFIYVTLKASLQDGAIKTEVEAEVFSSEEIKQENEDVEVIVLDQTNEDIEVPEDVKLERVEDESSDDPLDMAGTSQASETNCDTNWPDFETLKRAGNKPIEDQVEFFFTHLQDHEALRQLVRGDLISTVLTPSVSFHFFKIYVESDDSVKSALTNSQKFTSVSSLTPEVIKFGHPATGTEWELHTLSKIEGKTSKLVEFYVSLDDKIRSLMEFVRFWASCHNFPDLVDLLVIFFLQQEPYKLPPVKELQENTATDLIDGWNCAFKSITWRSQHLQNATITDLVRGFFRFYQNFDFCFYVISPFFGCAVEKSRFLKPYNLPEAFQHYCTQDKELGVGNNMDVQHPFELSKNLCDMDLNAFSVRCHQADLGGGGVKLTYVVEKETGDDYQWIQLVEKLILFILERVCGGTVHQKKGFYEVKGSTNIWKNRIRVAKTMKKPRRDLEREIFITDAVKAFATPEEWSFIMDVKFSTEPTTLQISFDPSTSISTHFIYFHLVKALQHLEDKTSSINSILEKGCINNRQIISLLDQLEMEPKSVEATISYLRLLFESPRKITAAPTVLNSDPLDVHIEFNHPPPLEKIASSLNHSTGFIDVVLNSETITCRFLQNGLTCRVKLTKEDPNNDMMRKCASVKQVRRLMTLVKFWADCHNLTGTGGFSSNAVYFLVVFFLQQGPWNLSLAKDYWKTSHILKNAPIQKLFFAFFQFYGSFDYISNVVSPYFGVVTAKEAFLEQDFDSSLCVLDFFNKSAGSFSYDLSGHFTALCRASLVQGDTLWSPSSNVCCLHVESCINKRHKVIKMAETVFKEVFQCSLTRLGCDKVTFNCTGAHNIWDKRITVAKTAILPQNEVDREATLSSLVIKNFPENSPWTVSIELSFTGHNAKVEFMQNPHLCHFTHIKLLKSIFGKRDDTISGDFEEKLSSFCKTPSEEKLSLLKTDLSSCFKQGYSIFVNGHSGVASEVRVDVEAADLKELKQSLSSKFTAVCEISGTVKCVHFETKVPVVLFLKDELEVCRSLLIQSYLNSDERIEKLSIFVKTWVGSHKLHLPDLALVLMVISFLQKDQKVPAVATLQQETIPYLVDGWNCAFAATKSTLSPEVTLLDLIEGFFKFYREFNCFYYALCPFLGRLITKKRFLAPMSLPKCYSTYVARNSKLSVDSGLCVQDPFNHSLNVAEEVSYEEVCKFSRICDHAIRVMRHCEKNLMESLLPWNRNDSHICKFTVPLEGEGSTQERVKVVNDLFKTMVVQVLGGEAKQRKGGSLNTQYKCKCPDVFTKRVESGMSVLNTLPPETTGLDKEIAITSSMNIEKDYLWCWGTQINVKKDPNMVTIVLQGSNPHVPSHFLYTQFRNFLKGGRPQPPDSHSGLKRANTSPEDSENKRRRIEGKEKQAIAHTEKLPKVNSAVQPPPNLLQSQGKIKLSRILKMINFDRQVSFVLTNYFVDQNVLSTHIKALKVDIKAALAPGLTVELHPYGSAVTKTFTPTSHFDFYVEILKKNPPVEPSQLLIQSEEFDKVSLSKRVLKCRHKTLQVTCSLEFSERIRIQTTRLIAYYLSLDKKLRQLLCLVKKWFRQSSDLENVISIYALCAMVIFYLQQKPYSLPAVNKLQFTEKLINEWNVAFTPVEFKCEALEKVSLKELFFGFFKFYARFDYYLYVIAPFSGEAVKKTSCGLTKVTSLICIQDFFVLDENLTLTVDVKSFEKLTKTLMNAVQIITFLEEEVLYNLLAQCRNGTLVETSGFLVPKETSWDVAQWISSTEKVALLILTKMFGCAITIINKKMISVETLKGGKAKFCKVYQKLESFANEKVPEITIECSAPSTLLWKNRGKILNQKNFAPETSDFDTDIAVSKLMLSKSTDKTTQHLQVVLTFLDKLGVVKIELKFKQDYHLNHFFFIKLLQGLKEEVPPPTAGPSYKILVVGLLEQHQKQIHDYFAGFGEIKSSSVLSVDKTIAVEFVFVEKDVYLEVIQKEHCILDTKIHLVPLGPLNVWKNAKFKDPILKDIHEVTKHKTFDQQAEALWKNRNIHKTTIERREEVVINDLNAALFLLFPHEPVYSGFKTEHHYLGNSLDLFIDIAPKDLVDVKKCISKDPNFDNVEINATTKNICFKGVHVGTRINFRLHLGRNRDLNRLLKHHLSSSAHIEKLVMIVTFWMKCHLDSFSKKMSYLLVVFFLQQQPYNLPPLMVPPISTNYSTALQESTMVELVTGFFKFYADFDYVYYVISPYYGLPVEKTCFLPPYRLPECFLRYQDNTPLVMTSGLCIQDVFDHAHNLSEEVSMNAAGLFSHLCRCSLETISLGETLLLYRLLLCNQECAFKYPEFVIKKPKELDEAEWRQKVKTNTVNILTKVLDYKWSQVSDFDSNKISFACVSQNDIWKHRIQGAKLMELLDFEGAEKEVAITKATKLEKATRNLFIQLIFTEDEVKVVFVKKTKSSDVFHVCHFLYTRLMRFLENTETSKFSEEVPEAPVDEPKHVVPCTDEVVTILDSEDEEEDRTSVDVPSDFFDDFVKEDFLDGLNIAEEWSNQESRKCDCSGRKRSRSSEEGEEKRMSSRVRNKSNSPEEPTRKKLSVEIRGRSRSGCMEDKQSEIDEQKLLLHNL